MTFRARKVFGTFEKRAPGARFWKVPKTFRVRKAIYENVFRLSEATKRKMIVEFHDLKPFYWVAIGNPVRKCVFLGFFSVS